MKQKEDINSCFLCSCKPQNSATFLNFSCDHKLCRECFCNSELSEGLRQINSKNRGNSVKLEHITIDTDLIIRDTTS